jgi:hypothetical protein
MLDEWFNELKGLGLTESQMKVVKRLMIDFGCCASIDSDLADDAYLYRMANWSYVQTEKNMEDERKD